MAMRRARARGVPAAEAASEADRRAHARGQGHARGAAGAVLVGCAGWNLPRDVRAAFPADGTYLARYAARLPAVEINTSFHRPHRTATYAKWAASVPPAFRFAVKVPRTITHDARLSGVAPLLATFLDEVAGLGDRLGCLLVQLPPSLAYDGRAHGAFVRTLRARYAGPVALEPRHASWFEPAVETRLRAARIARVAADPPPVPAAATPGGWPDLVYFRLHGSPDVYRSPYGPERLQAIAAGLRAATEGSAQAWCIFDNTTLGAATANALDLLRRLRDSS